ncbi:MAG: InlB B-repeat-containing protein, partial [Thermodesulfobacteriota bacterium]
YYARAYATDGTNVWFGETVRFVAAPVKYTLTVTNGTGGGDYTVGTEVNIEAAVPEGHHFSQWLGQTATVADPYAAATTLTVPSANTTVEAEFGINQYTLAYTAGDHGSLEGEATQEVSYGNDGTSVTAVPETGYRFTQWSDGSTANPRTDTNVTEDIGVTAEFAINTYSVTFINHDGSELKTETVDHGGSATAPAAPSRTGYTFTGWDTAFDNVASDLTVTAQYETNTYTVTFRDHDGSELKTETVNHGNSAAAPADPSRTGYTFTGWDTAFDNVTADLTVTAEFEPKYYSLTYSALSGGSIAGDTRQSVAHGESGTAVTAVADEGYRFMRWSDGSTQNPRTDIDLTGPVTVTANFVSSLIEIIQGIGSGNYRGGRLVTISADPPPPGRYFNMWTGDTGNVTNPYLPNTTVFIPEGQSGVESFSIQASGNVFLQNLKSAADSGMTIEATYNEQSSETYRLTVSGGTGSGDYLPGDAVGLVAESPPADQVFDQWTGDTVRVENINLAETKLLMPAADVDLAAAYTDQGSETYPLTVSGGTGSGDYLPGETVEISADSPSEGQVFDKWTGDTARVENPNLPETAFVMPAADAGLTAAYTDEVAFEYNLTVTGGTGGGSYRPGTEVSVSAAPGENLEFVRWLGHSAWLSDSSGTDTTMIMPAADAELTAEFAIASENDGNEDPDGDKQGSDDGGGDGGCFINSLCIFNP